MRRKSNPTRGVSVGLSFIIFSCKALKRFLSITGNPILNCFVQSTILFPVSDSLLSGALYGAAPQIICFSG